MVSVVLVVSDYNPTETCTATSELRTNYSRKTFFETDNRCFRNVTTDERKINFLERNILQRSHKPTTIVFFKI